MSVIATVKRRLAKVEILRKLDSVLDFSRSTVQLELLVYMSLKGSEVKPREAARELRINTKSVYDALSKLASKGLVRRASQGTYELTPRGKEFISKLEEIFGLKEGYEDDASVETEVSLGTAALSKNVIFYNYVYESMLAIGTSPAKELSLRDLSRILGVSESTLLDYLEIVSSGRGRTGLLKKVVRSSGDGRKDIFFRLTDYGYQELSRFMEYRKIRSSRALRYLMRMTRSPTIYDSMRRGSILSFLLSSATVASFVFLNSVVGSIMGLITASVSALLFLAFAK
jgi:DNA-binding PadR family transcriptional regulator